ncbi:hypothetical protein H4R20_006768, partial [Coemansia guatemalensis]
MEPRQIRDTFGRIWKRWTGTFFSFQDYRHISRGFAIHLPAQELGQQRMQWFSRGNVDTDYYLDEDVEDDDIESWIQQDDLYSLAAIQRQRAYVDEQAGHSHATADQNYAIAENTFQRSSTMTFENSLNASKMWHRALSKYALQGVTAANQSMLTSLQNSDHTLASSSNTVYDLEQSDNNVALQAQPQQLATTTINNRLVMYNISLSPPGAASTSSSSCSPSAVALDTHSTVRTTLLQMFAQRHSATPAASMPRTFRSAKQEMAVCISFEHKRDLIAILPTGGGKSLIYQLPAWYELYKSKSQTVTVVVSPLVALAMDIKAE